MKYIVVGDVHGDLNQLLIPMIDYLRDPANTKLIYLGDYLDRGDSNVYIYEIIKGITSSNDDRFKNIIFLRGNHDCSELCTPDPYSDGECSVESFISSCLIDEIPLKPLHYEPDIDILFSHGPINDLSEFTPSNSIMKMTDEINRRGSTDLDFAYKVSRGNYNSYVPTLYNIHGHDHKGVDENTIDKFFLKENYASISIDYDSSYMFFSFHHYDENLITRSKVKYISFVFDNDTFNDVELHTEYHNINEDEGFNRIPLRKIVERLNLPVDYECHSSYGRFVRVYVNTIRRLTGSEYVSLDIDDVFYNIGSIYEMYNESDDKILFSDVPYEIFRKLGYRGKYMPPYEIYYSIARCYNAFRMLYGYELSTNDLMKGGNTNNMILILICSGILVITLVLVILAICRMFTKITHDETY